MSTEDRHSEAQPPLRMGKAYHRSCRAIAELNDEADGVWRRDKEAGRHSKTFAMAIIRQGRDVRNHMKSLIEASAL